MWSRNLAYALWRLPNGCALIRYARLVRPNLSAQSRYRVLLSVRAPCETPRVFTSGHYDWRECPLNNRAKAHREFVRAHCLGTPGQRWAAWRAPHPYRTGGCRSRCQPKTYCLFDALDTHPESEPQACVMIECNKRQPPALDLVKRGFVAKT